MKTSIEGKKLFPGLIKKAYKIGIILYDRTRVFNFI